MKNKSIIKNKSTIYAILTIIVIGILSGIGIYFGYISEVQNILLGLFGVFSAIGLFSFLEIDDWTIWYKRLVIKKYNNKSASMSIKIYDKNLSKSYIEIPIKIIGYNINDKNKVCFMGRISKKDDINNFIIFYFTGNMITHSITVVDEYGNDINIKKFSLISDNSNIKNNYKAFKNTIKSYTSEDISINLNMINILNLK